MTSHADLPRRERTPPDTLSLRYCDTCPQTDRVTPLKDRHYSGGSLCRGTVRVATYRLDKR